MRILKGLLVLALGLLSAPLAAQLPSNAASLAPCYLFIGSVPANTTIDILTRGQCNIPQEATSLFIQIVTGGSATNGKALVWPFAAPQPPASQAFYPALVDHSERALVQLCQPAGECSNFDLSIRTTTTTLMSIRVEGYLLPLP